MSGELVRVASPTPALKDWTAEQVEMATRSFAADCTTKELEVFAEVSHRMQLDPWLGQIVAIKRGGKLIIQETVEGYRAIAERTTLYGGYLGPWWRTKEGPWDEVWLEDGYPAAAKVLVIRKDWNEPAAGVASWRSNVQFYWDKQERKSKIVPIWDERPDEMLAKCAEVRALKRTFGKELAAAGVNVRDLTDAQVVTVEARRIGLDDDGRHALISEVTGGRTDSSRDLTDDETEEVRREIARRAVEDDEPAEEPGVRVIHQPGPHGDVALNVDQDTGQIISDDEADRRRLGSRIRRDTAHLTDAQRAELNKYRTDCGIDPAMRATSYTLEQLHLVDAWLDSTLGEPF